jgi:L-ectoine synthase
MKVIKIDSLTGTARDVQGEGFRSVRPVLAGEKMGFSVHKTLIDKGGPYHWHYKNHLEACYCISGGGILTNLKTKENFIIRPDTIYLLNDHDDHTFEALEDTVLISIFNPPVIGTEIHDKEGNYAIPFIQ